jgi:hypothetical protein
VSTGVSLSTEGPAGTPFSTARTTRRPKPVRAVLCTASNMPGVIQRAAYHVSYTAQHGRFGFERLLCSSSLRLHRTALQCGTTCLERGMLCARACTNGQPLRRYCMRTETAQHSTAQSAFRVYTETPLCVRIAPALSAGCGSMLAPGTCDPTTTKGGRA